MASLYPNGIDAFSTSHQDDAGEVIHAQTVNDLADAVNKIETALGTTPQGSLASVKAAIAPNIGDDVAVANVTANAADTYIGTGFGVAGRIQVGSFFRWTLVATKTGAGVATPIYSVRFGTAGTTADTARLTFTGPAQTAVADTAWIQVDVVIQTNSATGVIAGGQKLSHNLASTGFATQQISVLSAVSGTFDTTVAASKIGLSVNPGASGVWTIVSAAFQAGNLSG